MSPHLFTAPKGESILDVYTRMVRGRAIARRHLIVGVVVSHGCAIRRYLSFASLPLERLGEIEWGSNTGVSHIIYYQDKVSLH